MPSLKNAVENKSQTWRLRFAVSEIAASLSEYVSKEVADDEFVKMYE